MASPDNAEVASRAPHKLALSLAGGAFLCLALAGTLLWWRHGDAVFSHYLMAAVAWCF